MMLLWPNDSSAAVALSGGLLWLGFRIGFRGKMTAPVSDGRPDSKCPFALIQGEGKKKINQICLHCVCACMECEI